MEYIQIDVLRWPQREGSEFSLGWREAARRNLLLNISKGDNILYLDADERVSIDYKDYIGDKKFYFTPRVHWWGENIRVDTLDDMRWGSYDLRLFKNKKIISWHSKDKNGLHNYLGFLGIGVNVFTNSRKLKSIIKNMFLKNLCVRESRMKIYHYHYIDLNSKKLNDLRLWDIENCTTLVLSKPEDGLNYNRGVQKVVCVRKPEQEELNLYGLFFADFKQKI